jgi:hypothetical protein
VPQPGPGRLGPLGQVAAQLGDQPGDDRCVGVVVLVPGEVLGLPGPGHQQRLHTHRPDPVLSGDLIQHLPPVTGRLTGHHDRGEPGLGRPGHSPGDRFGQLPGLRPHRSPGEHLRILITQCADLLVPSQIERQHRRLAGDHRTQPGQPLVAAAISTREPARATVRHKILLVGVGTPSPLTPPGRCPGSSPAQVVTTRSALSVEGPRSIVSIPPAPGSCDFCRPAGAVKVERPTGRTTLTAARTGTQ